MNKKMPQFKSSNCRSERVAEVWLCKPPASTYTHCNTSAPSLPGYAMSTFIRRYSRYLNEKAMSYRLVAVDFTKMKRG